MARPEAVSDVLAKSLQKLGLYPRVQRFQVFPLWHKIVGDIAKHAKPRRLDGDVLFVTTSSSAWAQELTLMRRGIVTRINENLGGEYIKDVRFSEHLWSTTKSFSHVDGPRDLDYRNFMSQDVLTQTEKERIAAFANQCVNPGLSVSFKRFALTMEKRTKYFVTKGFKKCKECGFIHRGDRECPNCKFQKEICDFNQVTAILERYPETSDAGLSVMTGVRQKGILDRARRSLDSRWYQTIRQSYFMAEARRLNFHEQDMLRQLMVKLVSLRTGRAGQELTQEDLASVLGRRLFGLIKGRPRRK